LQILNKINGFVHNSYGMALGYIQVHIPHSAKSGGETYQPTQ